MSEAFEYGYEAGVMGSKGQIDNPFISATMAHYIATIKDANLDSKPYSVCSEIMRLEAEIAELKDEVFGASLNQEETMIVYRKLEDANNTRRILCKRDEIPFIS